MRLPSAQYRTVILRLPSDTARTLAMASSRENVDAEVLLERIIPAYFSADGKTVSERNRARAIAKQEALAAHHKKLGLSTSSDADTEEVDRLVRLANTVQD